MRFAVLVVGLALLLAGCIGGTGPATDAPASPTAVGPTATPTDDESTVTTTARPTGRTETATETPVCEETAVTTVDPEREEVTPSDLPERPESLDAASAESFAEAYEQAYKRNTGLDSDTTQYEVWVGNLSTTTVDGGYVVTMNAGYWYNAAEPVDGTVTPTVVHADGPRYRAAYFVGEDRVRRDTTLDDDALSPHAGTIVECWSSD